MDNIKNLLEKALDLLSAGNNIEAISYAERVIDEDKTNHKAYWIKSLAYSNMNENNESDNSSFCYGLYAHHLAPEEDKKIYREKLISDLSSGKIKHKDLDFFINLFNSLKMEEKDIFPFIFDSILSKALDSFEDKSIHKSLEKDNLNTIPPEIPKKIQIMADYGLAYAWDDEGACIGLDYYFEKEQIYEQIVQLEKELEKWSNWFYDSLKNNVEFPWDAFHEKGLSLSHKLAKILKDTGITISYLPPFEDPKRGYNKEIIIKH